MYYKYKCMKYKYLKLKMQIAGTSNNGNQQLEGTLEDNNINSTVEFKFSITYPPDADLHTTLSAIVEFMNDDIPVALFNKVTTDEYDFRYLNNEERNPEEIEGLNKLNLIITNMRDEIIKSDNNPTYSISTNRLPQGTLSSFNINSNVVFSFRKTWEKDALLTNIFEFINDDIPVNIRPLFELRYLNNEKTNKEEIEALNKLNKKITEMHPTQKNKI